MINEMLTTGMAVQVFDTPDHAPNYPKEVTLVRIEKAIVVKNGTVQGRPTVDLQIIDADGGRYVVMATGGIIEMLAAAVKGAA